ncbi:phosphate ABC transporter substrate-binding protein [Neobacillus sp. PS3-34]|uniref:phosphate ABC transporter substrate-binding protein n=1 Tax=Neobacillus sp. PS3-34 TaxID=3070678 RepID=UPI0027E1330C|nr:phosphate ABC transporter substrate-binding protein [Neobacillus sp. PS3-34]WML47121.1 phosphate ABC transporter substrate-binding protein [Neobacillus sp. PS3-34]
MKKTLNKITLLVLSFAMLLGFTFSAGSNASAATVSGKVVIAGSTALLPLTQQAASDFKKKNRKVRISVSGSSSIAGPQSVLKGSATIGACDWDATTDVPGFKAFKGLVAHKIAVTTFAIIVNKSNKVENLTTSQLQEIYSGKITNWKQVGGADHEIVVVTRSIGSGTRVNFIKKALNGEDINDKGSNVVKAGKSGEMVTKVAENEYAIGYVDLPYVKGNIKAVEYNGVAATTANVKNGKYPVWEYGYVLTKQNPSAADKAFISYLQSATFQKKTAAKLKFIPLGDMKK